MVVEEGDGGLVSTDGVDDGKDRHVVSLDDVLPLSACSPFDHLPH
jgi:hypothetical protein